MVNKNPTSVTRIREARIRINSQINLLKARVDVVQSKIEIEECFYKVRILEQRLFTYRVKLENLNWVLDHVLI